jgi:hypothetical protein
MIAPGPVALEDELVAVTGGVAEDRLGTIVMATNAIETMLNIPIAIREFMLFTRVFLLCLSDFISFLLLMCL